MPQQSTSLSSSHVTTAHMIKCASNYAQLQNTSW